LASGEDITIGFGTYFPLESYSTLLVPLSFVAPFDIYLTELSTLVVCPSSTQTVDFIMQVHYASPPSYNDVETNLIISDTIQPSTAYQVLRQNIVGDVFVPAGSIISLHYYGSGSLNQTTTGVISAGLSYYYTTN
jgi:hypothetical protein